MVYAGVHIAKTNHVIGAADDAGSQISRPLPDSSRPYMVGICGRKPRRCVRGHKGERALLEGLLLQARVGNLQALCHQPPCRCMPCADSMAQAGSRQKG